MFSPPPEYIKPKTDDRIKNFINIIFPSVLTNIILEYYSPSWFGKYTGSYTLNNTYTYDLLDLDDSIISITTVHGHTHIMNVETGQTIFQLVASTQNRIINCDSPFVYILQNNTIIVIDCHKSSQIEFIDVHVDTELCLSDIIKYIKDGIVYTTIYTEPANVKVTRNNPNSALKLSSKNINLWMNDLTGNFRTSKSFVFSCTKYVISDMIVDKNKNMIVTVHSSTDSDDHVVEIDARSKVLNAFSHCGEIILLCYDETQLIYSVYERNECTIYSRIKNEKFQYECIIYGPLNNNVVKMNKSICILQDIIIINRIHVYR